MQKTTTLDLFVWKVVYTHNRRTYFSAVTQGGWTVAYRPGEITLPAYASAGLFAFRTAAAARGSFPRTVPCSLSIWLARTTCLREVPNWIPNYSCAREFGFTPQTLHDFWRERPDRQRPCPTEPQNAYLALSPEADALCADLTLIKDVTLEVLYPKDTSR